jgi:hypothetical protein
VTLDSASFVTANLQDQLLEPDYLRNKRNKEAGDTERRLNQLKGARAAVATRLPDKKDALLHIHNDSFSIAKLQHKIKATRRPSGRR